MALKDVIQRNGLNQRELAESLGVAPETLSRWVQNHKRPTGENLVRLLAHLRQYEQDLQAEDLIETSEVSA